MQRYLVPSCYKIIRISAIISKFDPVRFVLTKELTVFSHSVT
jgi:hypothetical protein